MTRHTSLSVALLLALIVSTSGIAVKAQQDFVFVEYKLSAPMVRRDLVNALQIGAMRYSVSNDRRDEVRTTVEQGPNGAVIVRFIFFTYFSNPPAVPKRWQTTDLNLYLNEEYTDRIVIRGEKPGADPPSAEGLNAHVQGSFDAYIGFVTKEILKQQTKAVRIR